MLPVSLDTYKYLKDEQFTLVSEYLALNSDDTHENKITFSIQKDKTMMRVYLENDEIYMTLRDRNSDKAIISSKTSSFA